MISEADIETLIHAAEDSYRDCWGTLCRLKRPNEAPNTSLFEDLSNFQPTLARALFDLDENYRALHQEKLRVIAKKKELSPAWFKHRLRTLDRYRRAIKVAISLGRRLGDSFAWIFYGSERELLLEHHNHQRQPHTPPGIGGLGELKFLEQNRVVNGHFVLYHGITSFLRVGDISLIDMRNMNLAAIGELKTTQVTEDELDITVYTVGPSKEAVVSIAAVEAKRKGAATTSTPRRLPQRMSERLDRQVTDMVSSFRPSYPEETATLVDDFHVSELEALCKESNTRSFAFRKAGDSHLLLGMKLVKRSLAGRLLGKTRADWTKKVRGFEEESKRILRQGADDNEVWIGPLFGPELEYSLTLGMEPLFWWPLDLDVLEALHFHNVMLFSVYNPAHLAAKLRAAGFEVEPTKGRRGLRIVKRLDNKLFVLEDAHYFTHLVAGQFWKEEAIVNILSGSMRMAEERNIPPNTRIEMRIQQHFEPQSSHEG